MSPEVQLGVARHVPERTISVLPAFCGIADPQTSSLSDKTRRFVGSGGVTVVVSAYRVRPFRGGGDLYGLGFAARVFEPLAAEMGDLKLAVFVAHRAHSRVARRYLSDCYRRLERDYPGRVHLAVGEPLVPALGPGTIYLRPTSSDGDAVSVREALALGVPVLASDVAQRPPGVRVLPLADRSRWVEAVREAVRPRDRNAARRRHRRRQTATSPRCLPCMTETWPRHEQVGDSRGAVDSVAVQHDVALSARVRTRRCSSTSRPGASARSRPSS